MVAADIVVLGFNKEEEKLKALLIRRGKEPFRDKWAFPGGFVEMDESCDAAAQRELQEETGISDIKLKQFKIYSKPDRDPRGRVISIVYFGMAPIEQQTDAADDAADVKWFKINELPDLAFDHNKVLQEIMAFIKDTAQREPFGLETFPEAFNLSELCSFYEEILQKKVNKRTLQRKLIKNDLIIKTSPSGGPKKEKNISFNKERYVKLKKEGFCLDL